MSKGRFLHVRVFTIVIVGIVTLWNCTAAERPQIVTDSSNQALDQAAIDLAECLTQNLPELPCRVPVELDGSIAHRYLPRRTQQAFRGICGHYHLSTRKKDPGPKLIDDLAEALRIV